MSDIKRTVVALVRVHGDGSGSSMFWTIPEDLARQIEQQFGKPHHELFAPADLIDDMQPLMHRGVTT